MFKVNIGTKSLSAFEGENLRKLLIENGFYINSICGGNGTCGKCIVKVNGKDVKSCSYVINSDISVTLPEKEEFSFNPQLSETINDINDNDGAVLCLDIGTTTLALAKASSKDGKNLKVITKTNPQRAFGADVISRIDYCRKNSVTALKDVLIKEINEMIKEIKTEKALPLFVSGNTCMLHFFFGEDASSLGVYPYTPVFLDEKEVSGETLGLKNVTEVKSLPCISAFVGADLTAGLVSVGNPKDTKYNVLIDLGTNAEIIIFSKNSLYCTSAAAGPCFEGGNISCGMSACEGAIYSFSIDESGKKAYKTIGNTSPKGICGTALFDIIAELLKKGIIDETGYMAEEAFEIAEDIILTQKDVRQFQLAKSAVYSALVTLMKQLSISFNDIENIFISGGFSQELNINNAIITGTLPQEAKEKIKLLGNTALSGTIKYASAQDNPLKNFESVNYIDLSADTDFSENFINNMDF